MQSPWKLLAVVEALALLAVFVLWPRGDGEAAAVPEADQEARHSDAAQGAQRALQALAQQPETGAPTQVERETVNSSGPATEIDALGIVLAGRIVDWEGMPARSGGLWLTLPDGESMRFLADKSGEYAIPGLQAGEYPVNVWGEDCRSLQTTITVAASPGVQRFDFELEARTLILIRLETSQGEELVDWLRASLPRGVFEARCVSVVPTPDPVAGFPRTAGYAPRSEHGSFQTKGISVRSEMPGRFTGQLETYSPLPLYGTAVFRDVVLTSFRLEEGVEELTVPVDESLIRSSLCEILLRVVDDATGEPIKGASVTTNESFGMPGIGTDADGRAHLTDVYSGLTTVSVRMRGKAAYSREFLLEPGPPVDLGEIRLRGTAELTVKGFLPDGSPAANVGFYYYDVENAPDGIGGTGLVNFTLSGDGEMKLSALPQGRVAIVSHGSEDHARTVRIVDVPPQGGVVEFHLEAGVETVIDTGTKWFEAYRFTLRDASGTPFGRRLSAGRHALRLPEGLYRIDVTTPVGDRVTSREFSVAGEPVRVEFDLP